jgi:hypothetical protein
MEIDKDEKLNSVAWVCEQTIPTEWPPLVCEVVPNFAYKGVSRSQARQIPCGRIHDYLHRSVNSYFF